MAWIAALSAKDVKIIGLISGGHMISHMYLLVLPPLFPILKEQFDVSYAALGLVVTVFGAASGFGQTPAGFLVDRIGGRAMLVAGLAIEGMAIALIGLSSEYWQLLGLFALAGVANCVFHPADYAIMTAVVPRDRLGRAFSFHSFTGNLAWAFTPAMMVLFSALWDWRAAFLIVGGGGVVYALILAAQLKLVDITAETSRVASRLDAAPAPALQTAGGGFKHGLALLVSAPVMMCFLYYMLSSMGLGGLKTFFVAAMDTLYGTPLTVLNLALSGLLLGTAMGILGGGLLADRFGPRRMTGVVTLGGAGLLVVIIGAVPMPALLLITMLIASGILQGLLGPTRDLVVRGVTPDGSMGKVMGFVSSGQSLGGAIMPPFFGWILDVAEPRMIFWLSAAFITLALVSFVSVKGLGLPSAVKQPA